MKRTFKTLFATAALLFAAKVTTDYDHKADFTRYHTYTWMKAEAGSPLWPDRIKNAVNAELSKKGLTQGGAESDLSLTAFGSSHNQPRLTTFYNGFGPGWGWGWHGFGDTITYVDEEPVGTLVLDMFDTHDKKLVWRGVATDSLSDNPDKNEKKLEHGVADMFGHFPPKPRG